MKEIPQKFYEEPDKGGGFYPRRFVDADNRHRKNHGIRQLYRSSLSAKESIRQAEQHKVAYLQRAVATIGNNAELYRDILAEEQARGKSPYLYSRVLGEILAAYLTYNDTAAGPFDFEDGIFEPTRYVVLTASMAIAAPEKREQLVAIVQQLQTPKERQHISYGLEKMYHDIELLETDPTGITLMKQHVQATKDTQHPGLLQPWVARGAQAAGEMYMALQQAIPADII